MDLSKLPKYHKDRPFEDPVVRCDACQTLLRVDTLRTLGMCSCGNRRVRNVLILKDEEMAQVKAWEVDPEWIALFGKVADG